MVAWLRQKGYAISDEEAVELGQVMLINNIIIHVCRDHDFKNGGLFYRFFYDEQDRGHVKVSLKLFVYHFVQDNATWNVFLPELKDKGELEGEELIEVLGNRTDWTAKIPRENMPPILFD